MGGWSGTQLRQSILRLRALDQAAVVRLNAGISQWPIARTAVGVLARWLAAVEIGLMVILAATGRRRSAGRMLAAVGLVYLACDALGRLVWPRPRPFETLPDVLRLVSHSPGRSFPSRHLASALAMAAVADREHRWLGRTMAGVGVALGLSRVAAGLHYPSDLLAGAILGQVVGRAATALPFSRRA